MQIPEFERHMARLREQYGANVYSKERATGIWKEVENLTEREWDRVVSDLISSHLQPPLLQKIREALGPYKSRLADKEKKEFEYLKSITKLCKKCGNTGYFSAYEIGTIYSAAFKCTCTIGKALKNNWQTWAFDFGKKYKPVFWDSVETDDFIHQEEIQKLKTLFDAENVEMKLMPGYSHNPDRERFIENQKWQLGIE